MEYRVATAHVGFHGMFHADAIAEFEIVTITGTTAVGVIGAGGKKRGEHAVLHVKHRHVLMDRQFEPRWRCGVEKIENLLCVEVVRNRDTFEAFLDEQLSREGIGDVEREVAYLAERTIAEKIE